jgi:alanyl-tRNA synthetase
LTTAELGPFRLQSEGAIAAGVRRIEAVTGTHGLNGIFSDVQVAEKLARKLGVPILELESKVDSLLETQRKLNKQLEQARRAEARAEATRLLTKVETRKEVPVVIANLGEANGEYLKWVADSLRDQFKGVAVLAGVHEGRVALLASVDKSLNAQGLHAGKLIKDLASKVGGGGGGRPDLAEAGGKDPSKLAQALAEVSW